MTKITTANLKTRQQPFRRARTLLAGAAWTLLLLPVAAGAQTEVERRVSASPEGTVRIENAAGSVLVTGWERSEVAVTGTLGRQAEELAVETDGAEVEVEVELRGRHRSEGWAHLEVKVPRGSRVSVEGISTEVTVTGVAGEVEVETVSGAVRIEGAPRSVSVETVSGGIAVDADSAEVSAESVSGAIELTGVRRRLAAGSVSGRVSVRAEELERAEVEIVSGRAKLDVTLAPRAEVEVTSHSGGVELRLPRSTSAHFRVESFSGRIDNELGPPARRTGSFTSEKELDFTLGAGGARVSIETFSGDVKIAER